VALRFWFQLASSALAVPAGQIAIMHAGKAAGCPSMLLHRVELWLVLA
jgi:hypothetical protein